MNEAADELERMAKEIDDKAAKHRHRGAGRHATWGEILDQAVASALSETAQRLRDRASILRPPAAVGSGQWWQPPHAAPGRVFDVLVEDGEAVAHLRTSNGIEWSKETRVIQKVWRYLGNADQPQNE
jgi:hypothetical protein